MMKINLRKHVSGGTTSICYVELPQVPAVGDIVVADGGRWKVESRVWVPKSEYTIQEISLYVKEDR